MAQLQTTGITGSLTVTSTVTATQFIGLVNSSTSASFASQALSASWAPDQTVTVNSASWSSASFRATSASFASQALSASWAPDIEFATSSYASASNFSISSSWASASITATSASYAPFTQAYQESGSWASSSVSASYAEQALSASWAPQTTVTHVLSASWSSASFSATSASFASQSISASWAPPAAVTHVLSASWASASFFATSASYASSSLSSSYTVTASYSDFSKNSDFSTQGTYAVTSSLAYTAWSASYLRQTYQTASWGPNFTMTNANQIYPIMSMSLSPGVWVINSTMTCGRAATGATTYAMQLGSGNTTYASSQFMVASLNPHMISMNANAIVPVNTITPLTASCRATVANSIVYYFVSGSILPNASTLTAFKIA